MKNKKISKKQKFLEIFFKNGYLCRLYSVREVIPKKRGNYYGKN